jgi:hypothetical protein
VVVYPIEKNVYVAANEWDRWVDAASCVLLRASTQAQETGNNTATYEGCQIIIPQICQTAMSEPRVYRRILASTAGYSSKDKDIMCIGWWRGRGR